MFKMCSLLELDLAGDWEWQTKEDHGDCEAAQRDEGGRVWLENPGGEWL